MFSYGLFTLSMPIACAGCETRRSLVGCWRRCRTSACRSSGSRRCACGKPRATIRSRVCSKSSCMRGDNIVGVIQRFSFNYISDGRLKILARVCMFGPFESNQLQVESTAQSELCNSMLFKKIRIFNLENRFRESGADDMIDKN